MAVSFERARMRRAVGSAGVALVLAAVAGGSAQAGWPPPLDATSEDMKDPANWPSDPGYGYETAALAKDRKSGQWQFYSFIPDRSPGAPPIRPEETASGMSVDLAWRHTIGDDRVRIAVLDSGIEWDEPDLVDKAWLNVAELAGAGGPCRPTRADGSACGGTGDGAGFDCNGDGIVSVSDWAETPALEPAPQAGRPRGDGNRNGLLDAGDLILACANQLDDDGNGYVDDVSGWDFFKDDNDPYDDTRYGHGTGEAGDSCNATNNEIGDAGICPLCRFVPLRVGDSFIVDANDFAQAVLYAADNGASVVQEALGTIDMSAFAQAALDYAWQKDVIVVASMADENSRHHNVPATANHTMPVHAVTMLDPGNHSTTARSFLAFNPCTNFGAQNFLSASGTGCSSEATGRLSGLSGLLHSMGLSAGYDGVTKPRLTAGEVLQIFLMTADDIDVPESRQPDSKHYWSQPGFDQRFGYGRVNANTAVEWVKAGRIPPEVDIVAPSWFEVLYADQVTAPVPIRGTVKALRATSYDWVAEWAPGVQPEDDAFETIPGAEMQNVPSSEVSGGDGSPLAELDVRTLDTTHEPDPDSRYGENERTITVRVRAVAHYGGELGDVKGELRRAYSVHRDADLLPGFPWRIGASGESSPKLADLDGDGVREIVLGDADGRLHALGLKNGAPEELPGFPALTKKLDGVDGDPARPDYSQAPSYSGPARIDEKLGYEPIVASPAIGDLDDDGDLEIVYTSYQGTLFAIHHDATPVDGWPVRLPDAPSCPLDVDHVGQPCMGIEPAVIVDGEVTEPTTNKSMVRGAFASPVLVDIDGDGRLEVVQGAFDGFVYVYRADATALAGWPVRVHYPRQGAHRGGETEYNRVFTTPAVADFDGDGRADVLVGSNEKIGNAGGTGAFYLLDGSRTQADDPAYFPGWPVTMVSFNLFPLVSEGVGNSPIAADLDGDGKPEGIMHGNASAPLILPLEPGKQNLPGSTPENALPARIDRFTGNPERGLEPTTYFGPDSKAVTPDTMLPLFAQPSAGDLDQDGVPDIVAAGGSLSMAQNLLADQPTGGVAQQLLGMWSGKTGQMLPASPILLEDFSFFNSQAIADLTNDGYPEVIQGSGGYFVHAVDACGREPEGWPKFVGQWVVATTAVGDVDGDDLLDVVVPTRSGWLYAWRTQGRTDGVIAWESFHHDNHNSGNLDHPLEQGRLRGDAPPLPVDAEGRCVGPGSEAPTRIEPAGGCCSIAGRQSARERQAAWLLAAPALLLARRRRRQALGPSATGAS